MQFSLYGVEKGRSTKVNQPDSTSTLSNSNHIARRKVHLTLAIGGEDRFDLLTDYSDRDNGVQSNDD